MNDFSSDVEGVQSDRHCILCNLVFVTQSRYKCVKRMGRDLVIMMKHYAYRQYDFQILIKIIVMSLID